MNLTSWNIFGYRDLVEIGLLAVCMYVISLWLTKDKTRPLAIYWYGYNTLLILSFLIDLPTVSLLFVHYAPVLCCFLFIVHQRTIQKALVTASQTTSYKEQTAGAAWIETLIQGAIMLFNASKDLLLVIEHDDIINGYVETEELLDTPISKSVMNLLVDSHQFDPHKSVWIAKRGIIRGFNAQINIPAQQIKDTSYYELPEWKQKALCLTKHTDALIIKGYHATRTFDVVVESKVYQDLNSHSLRTLLDYYSKNDISKESLSHVKKHKKVSGSEVSS